MAVTRAHFRQHRMPGTSQVRAGSGPAARIRAGVAAVAGDHRLSPLAYITLIALVTPAVVSVAGLSLTPSRVVFLCVTPVLMIRLFAGRYGRLVLPDYLILFFTFWMVLGIFINNPDVAIVFGGMNALILLGGYLVGRATVRSAADFQAMVRFLSLVVILLLPLALFEAFTTISPVKFVLDALPGIGSIPFVVSTPRLGIDRVQLVFSHPIHWGLFCSIPLGLYFVGLTNREPMGKRMIIAALLLGATFTSVSSGPLLSALFQVALIGYLLVFGGLARPWALMLGGFALVYPVIEVMSDRVAIYAIAERLAFNPATANIRRVLWEYGTAQVAKTPILGVGFNEWEHPPYMSGSIDNYWLMLAIIFGLPACIAVLSALFAMMIFSGRGLIKRGTDLYYARVSLTFLFVSLFLSLSTVAVWGEALSVVYFIFGTAAFLLQKDTILNDPEHAPAAHGPADTARPSRPTAPGDRAGKMAAAGEPVRNTTYEGLRRPVRYTRFDPRKR